MLFQHIIARGGGRAAMRSIGAVRSGHKEAEAEVAGVTQGDGAGHGAGEANAEGAAGAPAAVVARFASEALELDGS